MCNNINPLNAELNPICHLLALLGAHPILHVSRVKVKPINIEPERTISIVKLTRCTIFEFIEYHSTCFGRSFRLSSGVQDCIHSIRYMSYRLVACLLAGTRFHLVPASKQSTNLYDIYLMLCIQS